MANGLTQTAFAKAVGLTQGRVSQLVREGLPVGEDGRIDEAEGKAWIDANLDPDRRRRARPAAPPPEPEAKPAGAQASVAALRSQKLFREAVLLDLEVKKRQGELIDRAEVERTVFARARMERDAWLGFTSRAVAALAAEAGVDPGRSFAILDRIVREHLSELASTPLHVGQT